MKGTRVAMTDENVLREYLHWVKALLQSMETALHQEDPSNIWKHGGYRQFARKYNQIVTEVAKNTPLPPIIDLFDIDRIPGGGDTLAYQQKEIFESVYANASVLKGILESKIGIVEDEISALRDFFHARLRSAIFVPPNQERDIQNTVEQLLIGRGFQKGEDYDREAGRVKVSSKEVVPDFILMKLGLAIEIKLVSKSERIGAIIDEINADIGAYSRQYRSILFIVYDVGHIRDEIEFRRDLEHTPNVSVIVVKH